MNQKKRFTLILLLSIFILLIFGPAYLYTRGQYPDASFQFIDGNQASLKDYRGNPLVVLFWSTTCQIYLHALPHVKSFYLSLNNTHVEMITVAMPYDPSNRVLEFAELMDLPFSIAIDIDNKTAWAFGNVSMTPITIILSPENQMQFRETGKLEPDNLQKQLLQMMPADHIIST